MTGWTVFTSPPIAVLKNIVLFLSTTKRPKMEKIINAIIVWLIFVVCAGVFCVFAFLHTGETTWGLLKLLSLFAIAPSIIIVIVRD